MNALKDARAPDEAGAEDRAWNVVRAAYAQRGAGAGARVRGRRVAAALALGALIGVLALSPAGATVGRLITRALGVREAQRTLFSLPAPGRLLVSGPDGTWSVAADGATRRLGPWRQASWSPHGLFVAVAGGDRLLAVDPHGTARWSLARPGVADPSWFPPSGFRVAYRSGDDLRVVAGDGTGDRLLARGLRPAAPVWRPGHAYELAYVSARGRIVVRDADTAAVAWSARGPAGARELAWSADGARMLAVGSRGLAVYDARGARVAAIPVAATDASLSPDGRRVAVVRGGDVVVAGTGVPRRVLSGAGLGSLAWSPDGRWLLVSWPTANQWVFVRVAGKPRIVAFSRIRQQFAMRRSFPRLDGWCCTAQGTSG
jgi:hypothetical protein